jgi:hypothetical protein
MADPLPISKYFCRCHIGTQVGRSSGRVRLRPNRGFPWPRPKMSPPTSSLGFFDHFTPPEQSGASVISVLGTSIPHFRSRQVGSRIAHVGIATQLNWYGGRLRPRPYVVNMKIIVICAAVLALTPFVKADTVVVGHERNVVVVHPEHHYHHYYHRHHVVVVEHN